MPEMKNVSKRTFVIAGKTLNPNQVGEFAQSVIDRHVRMYQGELEQVGAVVKEAVAEPLAVEDSTTSVKKYPSQMNKDELIDYLTEKGIDIPEGANLRELKELAR